MTTPFAMTIPMSMPSPKVIKHRARKPTIVVIELEVTLTRVFDIA